MDWKWWALIGLIVALSYFYHWCLCAISARSDARMYDDDPE